MNKILIVDDSKGWLDFHVSVLEKIYGDKYILETASSGQEGYEKVYASLSEPYCLIISDLQMEMSFEPKHAGEWFVEQVKKINKYKRVPIIIVSAAYNIRTIAMKLEVNCLPKYVAANDLNAYSLAMQELLEG